MSSAWMPWYIGDYRRDTGHLSTLEHGAYRLLIDHYWETGPIPDDDEELAQITLLSVFRWRKIRPKIERFFVISFLAASNTKEANAEQLLSKCWFHKRIDTELEKMKNVSLKRALAGHRGGIVSRGKTNGGRFVTQAIAKQTGTQAQAHREPSSEDSQRGATEKKKMEVTKSLADVIREKGWA